MPFKSQSQRRYMHSKHPEIAKRWEDKYPTPKNLPEKKRVVEAIVKKRSR